MPDIAVWLIFLLPLFSFVIISFIIRPFFNSQARWAGYMTVAAIAGSLGLSFWALASLQGVEELPHISVSWAVIGDLEIKLGLLVDRLTVIMLIVITTVSLMVQYYSQGYMHGDAGYCRYFAFMSLFTASMLGLVLASNLLLLYVFWELVGLCSYLLIGFWFHRPSAANAAKKAFIVTRLGDFGFLIAILLLYFKSSPHTFEISELSGMVAAGALGGLTLTWAAIGIFSGAMGKSAQFPLHTWLPDAMEGPTPVSALIHAATMVAAGVYLVARTFGLFAYSEAAIWTVAGIGAFTAIFAASMGLVMNDIKRVLAYSTISQLGYMMLGLGAVGVAVSKGNEHALEIGMAVGMFHLFNHAFFKALLFLGAGSVNHATGTFDMRLMGGLRKYMPWTYATFLVASLSIAGIWPLAGFWSKDEILLWSWDYTQPFFWLAMITVFMTAFYMFRALFMTFGGEYRGGAQPEHGHADVSHPHESPLVMLGPMLVLGALAIFSGWLPAFGFLSGEPHGFFHDFFKVLTHTMPWMGLIVAGAGILLAYAVYSARWLSAEKIGAAFQPLYRTFARKYWFDELYENVLVVRVAVNGVFRLCHLFDDRVVDGVVNGVARITVAGAGVLRQTQTGQLQTYGLAIVFGVLVTVLCLWAFT